MSEGTGCVVGWLLVTVGLPLLSVAYFLVLSNVFQPGYDRFAAFLCAFATVGYIYNKFF